MKIVVLRKNRFKNYFFSLKFKKPLNLKNDKKKIFNLKPVRTFE